MYYGIFSGAFDLTGHEVLGLKEALVTIPLVFVLTALTYMIYPYPKNLAPWLLIVTAVLNAVLGIQIMVLMFTLFIAFIDIFR